MPYLYFTPCDNLLSLEYLPPDYTELPVFCYFIDTDAQGISDKGAPQNLQILYPQEKTL